MERSQWRVPPLLTTSSSDVAGDVFFSVVGWWCVSPPWSPTTPLRKLSVVVLFKSLEPVFQILQIYKINLVSIGKGKKKKNHDNRFTLGICQIKGLERREWRKTQRRRRIERRERGRKVKDLVHWFCPI